MFKPIGTALGGVGQPQSDAGDVGTRRVFMVLHGFYGNLFLSKFATGQVEAGEDQGIANARKVWAHSLREFDGETVKGALRRCQTAHPEFPPSLPQFVALCRAIAPRPVYVPPPSPPTLPMAPELREKYLRENRQRATEAAHKPLETDPVSGLDLLKRAVASAVAEAGGDEAATLVQLDRILARRSA